MLQNRSMLTQSSNDVIRPLNK